MRRLYISFFGLTYVFLAMFLVCCEKQGVEEYPTLGFEVKEELLGPMWVDSLCGIAFSPPTGWQPIPESIIQSANEKLTGQVPFPSDFKLQLVQIFMDSTQNNFCSVTHLTTEKENITLTSLEKTYLTLLQDKFPGAEIKQGRFQVNHVKMVQYLVMTANKVIFKILVEPHNSSFCQVDYAIAQSSYSSIVKSIESSIGSIHTIRLTK